MLAAAFFEPGLVRHVTLRLKGEQVRFKAYPFPDAKLMVIASSQEDGRIGKAVLHSNELRERTKGATEHMEVGNSFRLQAQLEHIAMNGYSEESTLQMRISELRVASDYLMHCGQLKEGDAKEIFGLLRAIEHDLGEPKRNAHKRAASRNVGKGIGYRSPKAGNPVGPVAAIASRGAIKRIENRIAQIMGVRTFATLRLALVTSFNKEAEQLFKSLKEEKSMNSEAFAGFVNQLERMRLQPFEAPSRRIEKLYDSYRYGDAIESEVFAAIRREIHAVLLVCVVERQVIRRLSYMTHRSLEESKMKEYREAAIHSIAKIAKHVAACSSFSQDARSIAATKLEHARNILAQEDLFETPKKRLKSADKILKELTAILPV
jgi:hypothetical protein